MPKFSQSQKLTKSNIEKVQEKRAIIYKILNKKRENLYTGIAGRSQGQDRLLAHKNIKKEKIPGGTRFRLAQVKNKEIAKKLEEQIIKKEQPKFNVQNKKSNRK